MSARKMKSEITKDLENRKPKTKVGIARYKQD